MNNMTDNELNEAIFKAKNPLNKPTPREWYYVDCGLDEKTKITIKPDYTHSWELCGELLEEISAGGGEPSLYFDDTFGWACNVQIQKINSMGIGVFAPTPQRAICEAWLAWNELGE